MTDKRTFILSHPQARANALHAVNTTPDGYAVVIRPPTRSLDQNAKLWAALTDVSRQVVWHGRKLEPESWKHMFTAALSKQDVVPGIEGGFVVLGKSTSKMTKAEMAELIELITAFGVQQDVAFGDGQ